MYVIIMVEDRSLIVQAEAGQRVKKTAAIGMGVAPIAQTFITSNN